MHKPWFKMALEAQRSPNPAERECVILGNNEADGAPFYVPLKLLGEHMHIEGSAGSGKTAGMCALIEQMSYLPVSVVPVDLKGDSNELLASGSAGGKPRKVFIDRVGWPTNTFNIFEQAFFKALTPGQKASLIGSALGCTHGLTEYGKGWYGGSAYQVLYHIFSRVEIRNWAHLAQEIHRLIIHGRRDELHSDIRAAGLQAYLDVSRMAAIEALNVVGNPHGIDLASAFQTPQLLYFCLPSGVSHEVAGAVARLVIFGLFDAAAHVKRQVPVFLFCDEFQRAVSKGLETVLQQARSCGIGLVLANQTIHDLVTKEKDFRPTMKACCRLHWQFGEPSPAFQAALAETCGTYEAEEATETKQFGIYKWVTTAYSFRKVEKQRLPINEIKRVTGDPRLSFFTSSGDDGLYQYGPFPQIVEMDYHITREEYERRKAYPWPDAVPGCIITRMPSLIEPPDDEEPPPVEVLRRPPKNPPSPRRSKE